MDSNKITPFAMTNFRTRRVFGIKQDDRRRHMYIIGKTGMGKSTLLENLVYSDIQDGHGVAYVDPHGDTAEKILKWIPPERVKDVIYFNPADREFPIAFNVLEKVPADVRDKVASGLVSVYKKLWADSWGPRLEYILRYCILALMFAPDSTLLGINRMLVDEKYRKIVLAYVTDPVVKSFWEDEFSKWNEKNLAEVISPIQNKVGQFLSNSMIRNIVGQVRSSFDLRQAMDDGKIIILNLSKGRMGEDASALLGAMMITKIQLAAMSRVDIVNEEDRRDFYLYVDEFQNFATDSFATILSEARKYRLCLTMAHQYIAQLEQGGSTAVRDAVFGNVGTLITFRVGAADAEFLEKEFSPQFMAPDIINLPKFKMYLRLMIDGVATEPFSADALPPLASKDLGQTQAVIDYTRKAYAADRVQVEEDIYSWQKADGGIINKESLASPTADTQVNAPNVLAVYEELKAAEAKKKEKEEAKLKEKQDRENRPIVWRGVCDVDGAPLELAFEPDSSRPVLCQTHLKDFRKGALSTPLVEKMMERVYARKHQQKSEGRGQESGVNPKEASRGSQIQPLASSWKKSVRSDERKNERTDDR
ncbi:type IV secretion system DNA-binding domain-containing protein, partial [Candidatus Falkowbacteria bacterium]|nr:type IV secretion system DNA-binding domain-containing protein [Candidatus Falkowbacteria bacterium]